MYSVPFAQVTADLHLGSRTVSPSFLQGGPLLTTGADEGRGTRRVAIPEGSLTLTPKVEHLARLGQSQILTRSFQWSPGGHDCLIHSPLRHCWKLPQSPGTPVAWPPWHLPPGEGRFEGGRVAGAAVGFVVIHQGVVGEGDHQGRVVVLCVTGLGVQLHVVVGGRNVVVVVRGVVVVCGKGAGNPPAGKLGLVVCPHLALFGQSHIFCLWFQWSPGAHLASSNRLSRHLRKTVQSPILG